MDHIVPDFEATFDTRRFRFFVEGNGVIQQNFIPTNMDQHRWQAAEISQIGRRIGMRGIAVTNIEARHTFKTMDGHHGVGHGSGLIRLVRAGHIRPRADRHRSRGHEDVIVTRRNQGRQGQAAPGRVPANGQIFWRKSLLNQPFE